MAACAILNDTGMRAQKALNFLLRHFAPIARDFACAHLIRFFCSISFAEQSAYAVGIKWPIFFIGHFKWLEAYSNCSTPDPYPENTYCCPCQINCGRQLIERLHIARLQFDDFPSIEPRHSFLRLKQENQAFFLVVRMFLDGSNEWNGIEGWMFSIFYNISGFFECFDKIRRNIVRYAQSNLLFERDILNIKC